MNKIIDTHAHYDDSAFDEDRDIILNGLKDEGVELVVDVGADIKGCHAILDMIGKYDNVFGALGIHPDGIMELQEKNMEDETLDWLKEKCLKHKVTNNLGNSSGIDFGNNSGNVFGNKCENRIENDCENSLSINIEEGLKNVNKIVAVGEIGLDYFYPDPPKDMQIKWFERQLQLAKDVDLPVIIHSRDAAKDTYEIMKAHEAQNIGGIVHCYSYSKEMARDFLNMGFYIGIGGVLTFKNARKLVEVVEYLPMDAIVLETDCPYLAPVPLRGTRNYSSNIRYVVEKIADIKGISIEEIIRITSENACKVYRIPS